MINFKLGPINKKIIVSNKWRWMFEATFPNKKINKTVVITKRPIINEFNNHKIEFYVNENIIDVVNSIYENKLCNGIGKLSIVLNGGEEFESWEMKEMFISGFNVHIEENSDDNRFFINFKYSEIIYKNITMIKS